MPPSKTAGGDARRKQLDRLGMMLDWGAEEEKKCIDKLKELAQVPELPEYRQAQEALDKVQTVLKTTREQMARLLRKGG